MTSPSSIITAENMTAPSSIITTQGDFTDKKKEKKKKNSNYL